jgi:predicted SprT family Zn-dependent metalloprotease
MNDLAPDIETSEVDISSLTSVLFKLWNVENIFEEVQIHWSKRLSRALGRTQPVAKLIRLNPQLKSCSNDLLEEVLCHELAHIAAHHLHGESIRPHGPEWQALVRAAGYEPSVRIEVDLGLTPLAQSKCYTHHCPVCHTKRTAKKPMKRWRCSECVTNGLSGILEIEGEV